MKEKRGNKRKKKINRNEMFKKERKKERKDEGKEFVRNGPRREKR